MTDQTKYTQDEWYAILAEKHAGLPGELAHAYVEIGRLQARVDWLTNLLEEIERNAPQAEPTRNALSNYPQAFNFWQAGELIRKAMKGDTK